MSFTLTRYALAFALGAFAAPLVLAQTDAPPPPPPPAQKQVEEHFRIVERMPMFRSPGCDSLDLASAEAKMCADRAMLRYIYENVDYPAAAVQDSTQGVAIVTFIVEKDGSITGARVVRDPGSGTGDEALRVVNTFDAWHPGVQRGEPVRVQFNLPVKFRLE